VATLVVIGYESQSRAEEVRAALLELQNEYLIDLEDAVVAVREPNGKVKLHQLYNLTAAGALGGGFWGTLIGMLFLMPAFGLALGAAVGAISGALGDAGIDDAFMRDLAGMLAPGTAALCVLVRSATPDKVVDEISGFGGTVLRTSLSHEDEAKLQAALSHASVDETGIRTEPST